MAVAKSPAIEYLATASDCLDGLEKLLRQPIQSILNPPRTVQIWHREAGRFIDVPGPSQRKAAEAYSSILSDLVNDIEKRIKMARVGRAIFSFSCFGELPAVVLIKPLDADFENAFLLNHNRWKKLRERVRDRQARLIARLEMKDPMKGLAHAER